MLDKHCKVLCLILAIVLIAVLIKAVVSKGQLWKGDEEYFKNSSCTCNKHNCDCNK